MGFRMRRADSTPHRKSMYGLEQGKDLCIFRIGYFDDPFENVDGY